MEIHSDDTVENAQIKFSLYEIFEQPLECIWKIIHQY